MTNNFCSNMTQSFVGYKGVINDKYFLHNSEEVRGWSLVKTVLYYPFYGYNKRRIFILGPNMSGQKFKI